MTLLKCSHCPARFRHIANLSKHRHARHPQSVAAAIRNGQRHSTHMPAQRAKAFEACIREIAGLIVTVTPAIVSRDPSFAPAVLISIGRSIEACKPFIPGLST